MTKARILAQTVSTGNILADGQVSVTEVQGLTDQWILDTLKTVDGATSGLDADLLDGQHGSYYLDWGNVTNKPDPVITLDGDLSGSVTLTDLASGTLTATLDDSGVTAAQYGSSTAIPVITIDSKGRITAATTAVTSSTLSIAGDSGTDNVTVGTDTLTVTGGNAIDTTITNNTITIDHADTSSASNLIASSRTYVTGLAFDSYGHVTGYSTGAETFVDTDTTYSISTTDGATNEARVQLVAGGSGSGTDYITLKAGSGASISQATDVVTIGHDDTSSQTSVDNSDGNVIQDITLDSFGHITSIGSYDLDNRYYTETEADNRFVNIDGDTLTGYLTLHANPENAYHAATKAYVDNAITGLDWKNSVNLLAASNIALTGTSGILTIDGHSALDQTDNNLYRILLTGQTTTSENGIYLYTDDGSTYTLVRASDADTYQELIGTSVYVMEGSTYGNTAWIQSNHYITSFSGQNWVQFAGAGAYSAGTGLTLIGTTFSVDASQTQITALGTIGTGTWDATNISLGKGGTNASLTAVAGGAVYSTGSALAITDAGTTGQVLTSNGTSAPTWEDPTGGSSSWVKKTSTYTAVAGDKIIADTTSGAFTITLPASPSEGDSVTFADGADWWTHNLTIARNGSTIETLVDNFTLDIKGIVVDFIFDGSTWEIFSLGGGSANAKGAGGDQVFFENGMSVTTSYAITTGMNAMSAGPITILDGAAVTIPTGSTWTVV